jgi:NAD(P)-dependent dehydrogenase (short-subunit alcohol dehydrogenase family)
MKQRQVLITGGTGALGLHVTRAVLARGAHATVSFVHTPEAEALEASLDTEERTRLRLVEADVTREDAVAPLMASMPRLEVLIHLVGGFRMDALEETALADWRAHHDLVLTSTFLCCKHALRRMREGGYGRIVTVGSRAVEYPMARAGAYSAAKAGVTALTRVLAEETKGSDITANCVHPSIIDTPANRAAMGEAEAARWVRPERLAEVILMFGSEAAGELRGASVPVYGQI